MCSQRLIIFYFDRIQLFPVINPTYLKGIASLYEAPVKTIIDQSIVRDIIKVELFIFITYFSTVVPFTSCVFLV